MLKLKLENLVELDALQEKATNEILSVVNNSEVEWKHHAINTSNTSCDGDTEYFSTPFKGGYILLMGSELYYSLTSNAYTWCSLVDYESIYLGNYIVCAETYNKLVDMRYRMQILSA